MQKIIKIWNLYYMTFWKGLWGTLWLSAMTVFFGTLLGMLIALMHMGKSKILRGFADIYIEILRGTPILLQLYFFWLMLPKIMPFEMSDTAAILVALIINASAYISEIIRAGIAAVDPEQWEAARSLGLSETNMMRKIILPQAVKNILPALCNEFIAEVKGTSLASVFFIPELTTSYRTVQSTTFLSIQPLLIAGMIYLFVTTVLSWAVRRMERRLKASD